MLLVDAGMFLKSWAEVLRKVKSNIRNHVALTVSLIDSKRSLRQRRV